MRSFNRSRGNPIPVEPRERRFFTTVSRREWTWIKHTILARYLRPWSLKVGKLADTIWIVDCFAGAAGYGDADVNSSPVLEAAAARRYASERPGKRMRVICVERNRKNYADLVERMAGFGDVVTTLQGNFARHVNTITAMIGDDPALIFLDPIGLKAIGAEACRGLLERKGKTDLFVIVDFGVVHRTRGQLLRNGVPDPEITGAATTAANIDAFYAGSQRWRYVDLRLPVLEREHRYMQIYFEDVLAGWFDYRSAYPVCGSYGATPQYWMVNAASHVDAYLLMNDELARIDKQLYLRTYGGEGRFPDLVEELYLEKMCQRHDALKADILAFVRAAGVTGASFEEIVLGTLDRHFGQVKVGKWAGDYGRATRELILGGDARRQKERRAAAFDRWERIVAIDREEEQKSAAA